MSLLIDFCDIKAARFAVMNWHYSKSVPYGKSVKFGVWESGVFVGAIIYSRGANNRIGMPYNLEQTEICELTRVALSDHKYPVSQMLAITFKKIKDLFPTMKLIVSYADSGEGHHGGIYQATNWIYEGESRATSILLNGKKTHTRIIFNKYGTSKMKWLRENVDRGAKSIKDEPKHKYLMPLNKGMRKKVIKLHKPYPDSN